jgi:outer membrane protein assembly factor BamA
VKKHRNIFFWLAVTVSFTSCLSQKKFPESAYFLKRNEIAKTKENLNKEELRDVIKQKPNRKILGVLRLHLAMYNMGNAGDTTVETRKGLTKFWKKIKRGMRTIGEEPVFLDSSLTSKSVQQLTIYLQKKGYFNAIVTDSVALHNRKAIVTYHLYPGEPYKNRNIYYSTKDNGIDSILSRIKYSSIVIKGKNSEEDIIDKERERVTQEIRDHGFYFFNKNYITVERDSALNSHEVDVYYYVNRQYENLDITNADNHPAENHHPYRYNKLFLYTNYDSKEPDKITIRDTTLFNGVYFVKDRFNNYIRTNPLSHSISLHPGDLFLQRSVDHTYSRFSDLKIFKLINFRFSEEPRNDQQKEYLLNLNMLLSPLNRREYKAESELTHNGGNLGVAGSFSFLNRNLLKGAESYELKVSGGLESLRNFADSLQSKKLFFFNTFDIGPELNIGVKRFLFPFLTKKLDTAYYAPNTFLSVGFNYQERPDFIRTITKLTYYYQFRFSTRTIGQWYLADINSVKVRLDPAFYQKLLEIHDVNLLYAYRDHLIPGGHVTLTYSNQSPSLLKDFLYLRLNVDYAGNMASLFNSKYGAPDSTGKYYIFGLKYSQYVKPEADISYHWKLNTTQTLVGRVTGGLGVTYGNSKNELLPFDKAFFAGGANDIRAWQARTLGPGSYEDSVNIENGGDIKLVANLELRSSIFKILETALFIDAGNIWIRNDPTGLLPGAKFQTQNLWSQSAIGAGIGLRFNFSFFILRTDFALKLHDPALPINNRWVYTNKKFVIGDVVPNLAIGYPF